MKTVKILLIAMLLIQAGWLFGQNEARLLRFPAIYGDQIVFSYAGDLFTVDADGGVARKLTSHKGYEMFARFSPDGRMLAFTGQYDGNTEVFVMPAEGGEPRRLTFTATLGRDDVSDRMGPNNIVMGWTPDGKYIIYRSRKQSFNAFRGQLFKVPVEGGLSEELPLSNGGFCSCSPDGSKLAFNWVFREFRTWKYYQGGMADDIRIYDFKSGTVEKITDTPNQEIIPMWIGEEIFFLSDRDRCMNLFSYNTRTKNTEKVTSFTEYDIKFPSASSSAIVFENGGYIYKMDVKTRKPEKVKVFLADDAPWARTELKDVSKDIRSGDLSPNGERIIVSARGEIFSVPSKEGITYNLTRTPGVHERNVTWSPDGKNIAFISDASGEFEIYLQKQDGSEPARQLTRNADTYIFDITWSPDSKKILFHDRKMRLNMLDVASGAVSLVEQETRGIPAAYSWSPDSKWIAYVHTAGNEFPVIRLYRVETGEKTDVTDTWYKSGNPVFSDDGKYLYFTSARDFNPTYSNTEWNHAYRSMTRIYGIVLSAGDATPFAPKNDQVAITSEENAAPAASDKKDKAKKGDKENKETAASGVSVKIDPDGIRDREFSLPVAASNYANIRAIGNKVYYMEFGSGQGAALKMYDLEKEKETELGRGLVYSISSNGKKMLVGDKGRWGVIDLPSGPVDLKETVDMSGLKTVVDYTKEWEQIYNESWRQMRDFFYVENMHGLDWKAMKEKYGVLVPYVRHRDDLTYLIGELIGELSVGHAYVNSGEKAMPERISTGLFGAKLSRHSSGYFQVSEILKGANWSNSLRSPLTEPGNQVKEGEFILAVNGIPVTEVSDIYELTAGLAGKETELLVNSKAQKEGSRKVLVQLIGDESALYYYNWVERNTEYVNSKTNGEVGYIHIPDMGPDGLNEFAKHFYPQLDKKGLIIDDRGNGGGNVSPMIIERLQREHTRNTMRRNFPQGSVIPEEMMTGPKVLLIDRYSASDGDLFPYAFKKHELGTVIGTRSWGGVVGITGPLPFIDGQDLRRPEFASYSADESEWIIEGHGVDPDILIDNDPHQEYLGVDAQLDKAIEVITEQIKTQYQPVPPVPAAPDKSK
ncbi:MAG: S41 family peptidase [Bacteroidota bacterium]